MSRIHDLSKEPVLKTLFVIKAPKPSTELWRSQVGLQVLAESTVRVLLHDREMLGTLLSNIPSYVIQVYESPEDGFISFDNEENTVPNSQFYGVKTILELDPMYSLGDCLLHLHSLLKEIADDFAEETQIEYEYDEDYTWWGVQERTVVPILNTSPLRKL